MARLCRARILLACGLTNARLRSCLWHRLLQGWLEGMQGMTRGEKRRIWVPSAQSSTRGTPSQQQTVVVDMEVVRWLPTGEGTALRQERDKTVMNEQEEEARVAEAMRVAGRLASA